ncbi:MAG: tRNA 4-thiouridine(8) synthase ThiI [Deltaproteobacteria bacterium]|nr:tRNA 4-thiouridine(8) synthase ThiI [Deltaproteobacteria bacterium]
MHLLVRLSGEIFLKSTRVSRRFQKQLSSNLKAAFRQEKIAYRLREEWTRLWVHSDDERVLGLVQRIFGIQAISLIEHECQADLDEIVREGSAFYLPLIQGKRFAVSARRGGTHSFNSMDICRRLGQALNSPNTASMVDLSNPELTVCVDIKDDRAYFYRTTTKGPGGLPLGTGGHCVSLISGGFDSVVASWMLQKRGVTLEFLFCDLVGDPFRTDVIGIVKRLAQTWSFGYTPRLHIIDFRPLVKDIQTHVTPAYSQVILKRLFYRAASMLGQTVEANGIVTGEALGQVSSQTLKNLQAISSAVNVPILRPLVAFDKPEIITMSRKIGLYELSSRVKEFCQIVPQKPVTACSPERAEQEEFKLDMLLLETLFAGREIIELASIENGKQDNPFFIDKVPRNAVVIDCQSEEAFQKWHHETAQHWEFHDLLSAYPAFSKEKTYVVYCTFGTQSAVAVQQMRNSGFHAFSVKGGVKTLARH